MRRQRFLALVALLLMIGAFKLAQQLYRWQAFKGERAEIVRLELDLDSSALGIVATEIRAGTLRSAIETADKELASARSRLDNFERAADFRGLDPNQELSYRTDLAAFNSEVRRRNELVREWRQILTSNHGHVDRFNLIADSIRAVALQMGEPYFPILTPSEIAAEHGVGVVSDSAGEEPFRDRPFSGMTAAAGRMWRRVQDPLGGFTYLRSNGEPVRSKGALRRIRALAIPPAWTDVLVDPSSAAKVQAVGMDAAGRKQYRYNPEFVSRNSKRKFRRMLPFSRTLPRLRDTTNRHLKSDDLSREQVLATVVRLMCRAFFRVGSERYAVDNKTFGIATLEKRHLSIDGSNLIFSYVGKRQIDQRRVVADTPLVEILEKLLKLPGDRLFRYRTEDGEIRGITANDVNEYLNEILGARYTSKDIRTWGGTVRAATILADIGPAKSKREAEKNVVLLCKLVSSELGNTPAICRSAYIHPAVIDRYLHGETIERVMRKTPRAVEAESPVELYPEEAALMRMLQELEER